MPVVWVDGEAAPPAWEETVEQVERELGVRLPEDLRTFLRSERNGGYAEPNVFDDRYAVHQFFSAGPTDVDALDDLASMRRLYDPGGEADQEIPPEYVPFADDPMGNVFVLDPDGAVALWNHETALDDPDPFEPVAGSFQEFWDGLQDEPL
jgi:hypothetical protein